MVVVAKMKMQEEAVAVVIVMLFTSAMLKNTRKTSQVGRCHQPSPSFHLLYIPSPIRHAPYSVTGPPLPATPHHLRPRHPERPQPDCNPLRAKPRWGRAFEGWGVVVEGKVATMRDNTMCSEAKSRVEWSSCITVARKLLAGCVSC